jgi:tetratricopeptide (TPR) repeat protein
VSKPNAKSSSSGRERADALQKKLDEDPRSLVFVELSEELSRIGEYAEAADVAQRGLLSHPDSVAGRLALAVAEWRQDHIREALEQIKRALLIDQENPKALALMGRILLDKGLAKRAVQFLSHAVKLDPKEGEYRQLLDDARARAKSDRDQPPAFDGDQVPDAANPWNEEETEGTKDESQHTVFDPEALKKLRAKDEAKKKLDDALAQVPSMGNDVNEEPTKFVGSKKVDAPDPREEPTKFAADNPLDERRKPKMGGSASELSQMMKRAREEDVAEPPKPTPPPPPVPPSDEPKQDLRTSSDRPVKPEEKKPESGKKAEKKAESKSEKKPELEKLEKVEKAEEKKPPSEKKLEPEKVEEKKPQSEKKPPPPEKKPDSKAEKKPDKPAGKAVGPMATRMVDDALWALFGGAPEAQAKRPENGAVAAPVEEPKKKPEKKAAAKKDDDADEAAEAPRQGGMVVRTSERLGTWTGFAILLILCATSLWIGYAVALSRTGPGPEVASEELKGVAEDLELGGLAQLLSAEDKIAELQQTNPGLQPILHGAMAEVLARRWQAFGRDPKVLQAARAKVKDGRGDRPSVEMLAAMTVLSTGAASRAAIDKELTATLAEYPDSPKAWVLRAKVAQLDGRADDVPRALYEALAINPQHRTTLLELARWHAGQKSYAAAFSFYDQVVDKFSLDVEAAIERYVLGQMTGQDPAETQAVSSLAGLVRVEDHRVAKDETGRAAIAFAFPKLAAGNIQEGIDELGKAEGAFPASPAFREAVAGMYLVVGEWERAREHYQKALELDPQGVEHRIGLARANLGERAGDKVDRDLAKRRAEELAERGVAHLPFGIVRLVFGDFIFVEVEPDPSFFPEAELAAIASRKLDGADLQKALEAAALRAVAKRRSREEKHDEAIMLLQESKKLIEDVRTDQALGMVHLAKKEHDQAIRLLSAAVESDEGNAAARLALARAYLGKSDEAKALEILDGLDEDSVAPDALLLVARLKLQRGDYEGALETAERFVGMLPKSAAGHVTKGEALYLLKRDADAMASFEAALGRDERLGNGTAPRGISKLTHTALLGLGRAELERSPKRGVQLLRSASLGEEAPDEAHFFLGQALFNGKKSKKEGRKELELYLKLAPNGGRKDEAEKLLRKK